MVVSNIEQMCDFTVVTVSDGWESFTMPVSPAGGCWCGKLMLDLWGAVSEACTYGTSMHTGGRGLVAVASLGLWLTVSLSADPPAGSGAAAAGMTQPGKQVSK